jgi:GH24 family phage-related lysozyme (muramidase)
LNLLHTVDTALDLIKEEEGKGTTKVCAGVQKLCPYIGVRDPPHIVTQGYGKVVHRAPGGSAAKALQWMNDHSSCAHCWTEAEATAKLREHVEETSEGTVRRILSGVSLNKHQFSALVSAFYNAGSFARTTDDSGYAFHSDAFQYACKGSFNLIINARANGVKCFPLGLVRRRIRECVLFWTPDDETPVLPDRSLITSRSDPRLAPNQGYPTRLTGYYGSTNAC